MIVLYALSVLTILQGIYTLIEGIRASGYMRHGARRCAPGSEHFGSIGDTVRTRSAATGSVDNLAVFCPCKGIDHEFEKNARSILDQRYADFTVYFIVEAETDPAYPALKQIGASNILIAGEAKDCGQKVHNLGYAIRQAGATAGTYVFCDSDARYPQDWLTRLTAPLEHAEIAAATGYRWYMVSRFHFPTLLRSAWNATVVSLLGDHNRNFAWGGSLAIRRETFERIGVLESWRGAVSDDYAITRAAGRAGVRIHFVPACLIPSHGECSFSELCEFTTRQIIITRVYHPRLWRIGFFAQTIYNITFIWLIAAIVLGHAELLVFWVAIYGLSTARAAVRLSGVRAILSDPALSRFAWFYILSSPVVSLLYQYNMVLSAVTTHIEWRQIHYTLISPNETRVRR